jgi:outer membrane protein assembly factor BamB
MKHFFWGSLALLGMWGGISCTHPLMTDNSSLSSQPYVEDNMREVWHRFRTSQLTSDTRTTSLIIGNRLIIGYDSIVDCLDKVTGKVIWSTHCIPDASAWALLSWNSAEMVAENGRLYTKVGGSAMYCLDLQTGSVIWSFEFPGEDMWEGWGHYSMSDNAIFIATHLTRRLFAISKLSGQLLWTVDNVSVADSTTAAADWPSAPSYLNGRVYVGTRNWPGVPPLDHGGGVECYDATTGAKIWAKVFPPADSTVDFPLWKQFTDNEGAVLPVPFGNNIIASVGFTIALIDSTGKILWRKSPYCEMAMSLYDWQPYLVNGTLYDYNNGAANDYAWALDPNTGATKWAHRTALGSETRTLLGWGVCFDNQNIYKVTDDNELIGQSLVTGAITWGVHMTPLCFPEKNPMDTTSSLLVYRGGLVVEGERIYFVDGVAVHCYERIHR